MSAFTRNSLSRVDMGLVKERRSANFAYLKEHLPTSFSLAMSDDDVPMVYPYITDDSVLRVRLINDKIFVALYWPDVSNCGDLPKRILPLPIDQRYGEEDMKRIVEAVKS